MPKNKMSEFVSNNYRNLNHVKDGFLPILKGSYPISIVSDIRFKISLNIP